MNQVKKKILSGIGVIVLGYTFVTGLSMAETADFKNEIKGLYSTFSANFSYSSDNGSVLTGKLHYKYPSNIHIAFSDGRVIASDGNYLWIYNPESQICAKQTLSGDEMVSGGIVSLVRNYEYTRNQNRFVFRNKEKDLEEIVVDVDPETKMIKNLRLKEKSNIFNYSFSDVKVGVGIKASLFNYKPSTDAQVIENPLNRYTR